MTQLLHINEIEVAASLLRRGECVAFPTETVYGLGANALSEEAVAKIFIAKGRPADKPLIIHCHSLEQLPTLAAHWPKEAEILMEAFWPGPLTLIFKKKPLVPAIVTGGGDTVAFRFPSHPIARQLLETAAIPIVAPSANRSGKPSPTSATHVWEDLQGRIAAILAGGPTGGGMESTLLDCSVVPFRLLRLGAITFEQLAELAPITWAVPLPTKKQMALAHAKVTLFTGPQAGEAIAKQAAIDNTAGLKVAILGFENNQCFPGTFLSLGSTKNIQAAATKVYPLLRKTEAEQFDVVLIQGLPEKGLGQTIMNRLRTVADKIIET